jgi:hypothetical protein
MGDTSMANSAHQEADLNTLVGDLAKLKEDFADLARSAKKSGIGTAQESVAAVSHRIEEQPLASLLVAFGIGIVSGKLLLR